MSSRARTRHRPKFVTRRQVSSVRRVRIGEPFIYLKWLTNLHSLRAGRRPSSLLGPVGRSHRIGDRWYSHGRGHDELWWTRLAP